MTDTQVVPNLTTPSLVGLAYLLRHKELWPRGFDWNYNASQTCAVGLSYQFWGNGCPILWCDWTRNTFPIPLEKYNNIFYHPFDDKDYSDVTPEDIASIIDDFLKEDVS
jgi:hypothetical protein